MEISEKETDVMFLDGGVSSGTQNYWLWNLSVKNEHLSETLQ